MSILDTAVTLCVHMQKTKPGGSTIDKKLADRHLKVLILH